MKKIPADAFDHYFSLGPGRSYQQVADRYGVSKRAVTAMAKRENWQARLAAVEQKAQARMDEKKWWRGEEALPATLCDVTLISGRGFLRGDCNADGKVNVSDASCTLNWLFAGNAALSCVKAADANDTGTADITDAVYLLNFLFSGGPGPAAPFSECGEDPTPDELTCDSFAPCM